MIIILNCDCNNNLRLGLHYFIFRSSEKQNHRSFEPLGFRLHIVRVIIITIGVLLAKEFWTEIQDSRFTPLTINGWNLKTHPMNPRHGLDTL